MIAFDDQISYIMSQISEDSPLILSILKRIGLHRASKFLAYSRRFLNLSHQTFPIALIFLKLLHKENLLETLEIHLFSSFFKIQSPKFDFDIDEKTIDRFELYPCNSTSNQNILEKDCSFEDDFKRKNTWKKLQSVQLRPMVLEEANPVFLSDRSLAIMKINSMLSLQRSLESKYTPFSLESSFVVFSAEEDSKKTDFLLVKNDQNERSYIRQSTFHQKSSF